MKLFNHLTECIHTYLYFNFTKFDYLPWKLFFTGFISLCYWFICQFYN